MGKSGRLPVGRLPARLHLDRVPSAPAGTPAEAPGFRRDFPPHTRDDSRHHVSSSATALGPSSPWKRPNAEKDLGSQITAVPPPLFLAEPGYFGKDSFLAVAMQIDAAKIQRFLCLCVCVRVCACFQQDYDVTDECWREREVQRA